MSFIIEAQLKYSHQNLLSLITSSKPVECFYLLCHIGAAVNDTNKETLQSAFETGADFRLMVQDGTDRVYYDVGSFKFVFVSQ